MTAGNGLMSKSCSNGLDISIGKGASYSLPERLGALIATSISHRFRELRSIAGLTSAGSLGAVIATSISRRFRLSSPGKCRSARQEIVRLRSIFRSNAPRRLVQRKRRETLVAPRLGETPWSVSWLLDGVDQVGHADNRPRWIAARSTKTSRDLVAPRLGDLSLNPDPRSLRVPRAILVAILATLSRPGRSTNCDVLLASARNCAGILISNLGRPFAGPSGHARDQPLLWNRD